MSASILPRGFFLLLFPEDVEGALTSPAYAMVKSLRGTSATAVIKVDNGTKTVKLSRTKALARKMPDSDAGGERLRTWLRQAMCIKSEDQFCYGQVTGYSDSRLILNTMSGPIEQGLMPFVTLYILRWQCSIREAIMDRLLKPATSDVPQQQLTIAQLVQEFYLRCPPDPTVFASGPILRPENTHSSRVNPSDPPTRTRGSNQANSSTFFDVLEVGDDVEAADEEALLARIQLPEEPMTEIEIRDVIRTHKPHLLPYHLASRAAKRPATTEPAMSSTKRGKYSFNSSAEQRRAHEMITAGLTQTYCSARCDSASQYLATTLYSFVAELKAHSSSRRSIAPSFTPNSVELHGLLLAEQRNQLSPARHVPSDPTNMACASSWQPCSQRTNARKDSNDTYPPLPQQDGKEACLKFLSKARLGYTTPTAQPSPKEFWRSSQQLQLTGPRERWSSPPGKDSSDAREGVIQDTSVRSRKKTASPSSQHPRDQCGDAGRDNTAGAEINSRMVLSDRKPATWRLSSGVCHHLNQRLSASDARRANDINEFCGQLGNAPPENFPQRNNERQWQLIMKTTGGDRNGHRSRYEPARHHAPHQTRPLKNHGSALRHLNGVVKSIRKGQDPGQYVVMAIAVLKQWSDIQISRLGAIPKKVCDPQEDIRLIYDLSFPQGCSTNDVSSTDSSPNVVYEHVSTIARRILACRADHTETVTTIMEGDVKVAFRHLMLASGHVHWIAAMIPDLGVLIIDMSAPFSWTSSPAYYGAFGGAMMWLVSNESPATTDSSSNNHEPFFAYEWVDDHVLVEPPHRQSTTLGV
ncbi:hypothetical protein ON010_g11646 [Phytophthora cinnamomi]|nr:hypothetical protein ON010_g11646 [Phytophthora cinnamomi]